MHELWVLCNAPLNHYLQKQLLNGVFGVLAIIARRGMEPFNQANYQITIYLNEAFRNYVILTFSFVLIKVASLQLVKFCIRKRTTLLMSLKGNVVLIL